MIKKGSKVKVLIGKDKKKKVKLLKSIGKKIEQKLRVNLIKKHMKTTKEKKGGIITKENFINISNLMIVENNKDLKKEKKVKV